MKPQKIKGVSFELNDLGIKFPHVMFDKDAKEFFVEYAGAKLSRSSLEELERDLRAWAEPMTHMHWTPIIYVVMSDNKQDWARQAGSHGTVTTMERVGLELERFYIAKAPDGTCRRAPWGEEPVGQVKNAGLWGFFSNGPIELPYVTTEANGCLRYHLPYNDQTWTALETIRTQVIRLRELLLQALSSPDSIQALGAVLQRALPASTE